jgi:signal transduction histidine kinase
LNFNLNREINQSIGDVSEQVLNASRAISTEEGLTVVGIPPLNVFRTSSVYTQVWNTNGDLVDYSDNLAQMHKALDPEALASNTRTFRDVTIDDVPIRVLTVPIEANDQIIGHLQVAASLEPLGEARENLLVIMLAGGVVALALSALSGYWLADRTLRPLEIITQTAEQITQADDLGRRIPYRGSGDELSRLVNTFNATLARLERLFHAQQRLVADVSHELRTPLTSIRGNVDLLRRMGGDDEESLQAIESEIGRMSRLVGDILLLAKADAGRLSLVEEPVELDTLLLEVYGQAKVLDADGAKVSISLDDRATVMGDPDRLKQLLLNLVSNAVKYTTAGDTIELKLRRVNGKLDNLSTTVDWAEISVTDSGPGIPAEDLPHIFDRFYRVDRARARTQGGAGLGLSIARWIAQAHQGDLSVQSMEGRGATFIVRLPLPVGGETQVQSEVVERAGILSL